MREKKEGEEEFNAELRRKKAAIDDNIFDFDNAGFDSTDGPRPIKGGDGLDGGDDFNDLRQS